MSTADISRAAFDPEKRYTSVRMQQGRVILDDDFNESERIQGEEARRALLDLVGPAGSPDAGFRVANGRLNALGELTFDILPGTMYLGGLRLWNPVVQGFALQDDWLRQPAAVRALPTEGRGDLVYVNAWQQPVTAVEDAELFEVALGGPDTSVRLRTMWRVRLAPGIAETDCSSAWTSLTSAWAAAGLGTMTATGERVANARLAVGYEAGTDADDLCAPPVAGGYLGAENQAIRVQLVDASHVTWGFDNAEPLYRVQIGADRVTITMETDPKDQAHWPLAGQIVEILPWSALLSNDEKLAELSGHLSRVAGSYDPDSRTLTLATALPAGFGEQWTGREDQASLGAPYFFLRVWNRGDDQLSPVAIPFVAGTAVRLGDTGLNVTLTGTDFVATDHWTIAARPETPDQVVPWDLEDGRPPHGVRRFFTPLAVIRWHLSGSSASFELLSDCRPTFPPLTRITTCCTSTVGDGTQSHGQFSTIQDAVNNLPPEGGKVCVLAGEYRERVRIQSRQNVTIEGCGRRSRLVVPEGEGAIGILIVGSRDVTIRSLAIEAGEQPGIVIFDALGPTPVGVAGASRSLLDRGAIVGGDFPLDRRTTRILLEELTITALGLPAVGSIGGTHITLRRSLILAGPLPGVIGQGDPGRWPAVFLLADDVLIEDNEILAAPDPIEAVITQQGGPPTFTRTAMGGIQIGGGSERIEIRGNRILGGNGDGVTLGSWAWVRTRVAGGTFGAVSAAWRIAPAGEGFVLNEDGCVEVEWDPLPPLDDGGDPMVPVSMGALRDIRIVDNTITGMGKSGVGVARFFDLAGRDELITVDRLTIERNQIRECVRLPVSELPLTMRDLAAQGAITLADGEIVVIQDNTIERNGRSHVDPVCGIYALRAAGLSVERNRIIDNAPRTTSIDPPRPGLRGGIVVTQALAPATLIGQGVPRQNGVPAARVMQNIIVVPEGRCVILLGQGTMTIGDNQLTSRGVGTANRLIVLPGGTGQPPTLSDVLDAIGGATVLIFNLGRSAEIGAQLASFAGFKHVEVAPRPGLDPAMPVLAGGNVLFNDNQVMLDLVEATLTAVISSVAIWSYDDVSIDGNQLQCNQDRDLILANLMAAAWTLRVTGNRLEESLVVDGELVSFGISALCLAAAAVVTTNIASHCLVAVAALRVFGANVVLISAVDDAACTGSAGASSRFATRFVGSPKDIT